MKRISKKHNKTNSVKPQMSTVSKEVDLYVDYLAAEMQGHDAAAALHAITSLPLNERYLSRILKHLGLALSDLDTASANVDITTLPEDEVSRMVDDLLFRAKQLTLLVGFCMNHAVNKGNGTTM